MLSGIEMCFLNGLIFSGRPVAVDLALPTDKYEKLNQQMGICSLTYYLY